MPTGNGNGHPEEVVEEFNHDLESILMDSINIRFQGFHQHTRTGCILSELDAIYSSTSSGFLNYISNLFDSSKLQSVPSIKFCKLRCQVRALIIPLALAGRMLASKLFHYFSSHPVTLGF